ncbi:MAG: hypothetical protein ACAH80_00650 [Alphaproteobacteria bacterium]
MTNLKSSFRYSTGPLYSKGELAVAERYLADMGLTQKEDNTALGIRTYSAPNGGPGHACIYLDELGAHPNNSGTMIISTPDGKASCDTVWGFAERGFKDRTGISLVKTVKKALGLKF